MISMTQNKKLWFCSCAIFVTACSSFFNSDGIYSKAITPISDELYQISIDSRLEYQAEAEMLHMANRTCQADQKQRMLILEQNSTYVDEDHSDYSTGYFRLDVKIRCR